MGIENAETTLPELRAFTLSTTAIMISLLKKVMVARVVKYVACGYRRIKYALLSVFLTRAEEYFKCVDEVSVVGMYNK